MAQGIPLALSVASGVMLAAVFVLGFFWGRALMRRGQWSAGFAVCAFTATYGGVVIYMGL